MASVLESAISPILLDELARSYDFGDSEIVVEFLQRHPSLGQMLREAHEELALRFGPEVRISLAVINDPEETDAAMLFAFVLAEGNPDQALERLDDFNDEWWRVTIGSDPIPLHFALEYV
jgi:hypothetical protein